MKRLADFAEIHDEVAVMIIHTDKLDIGID